MRSNERARLSYCLSGEWLDWYQTKERVGQQLRELYQSCMTKELPPRLQAVIKKLEEELPDKIRKLEG
jgi:hypothetical protein